MGVAAAIKAVGVGISLYQGYKKNKAAGKAARAAAASEAARLAVDRDEMEYRRSMVSGMMKDATITEGGMARETGAASATVRDSFSKASEIEGRRMARYGVSPTSGRGLAMNKTNALSQAVAESSAVNTARRDVGIESRSSMAAARTAGIGITNNVSNTLGDQGGILRSEARRFGKSSSKSLSAGMKGLGSLAAGLFG